MPLAPTQTLPSGLLADAGDPVSASVATAGPADGFALALASASSVFQLDASSLPSVSLDTMLAAVAGTTLTTPTSPLVGAAGGLSTPGVAGVAGAGVATSAAGGPTGATVGGDGARILAAGDRYLGVPYRWGGTSARSGFDCSGLVQQVFADLGVRLPRTSVEQSKVGTPVASLEQAQPGDVLFFRSTGGRPNHIGIYAGDGRMLHAPRTGDVVRYQDLNGRVPTSIRRIEV